MCFQTYAGNSSADQVGNWSHLQWVTLHITGHDGIYFCTIIEESHTCLPIDLQLGYILDPITMLKGIRIQEGSALFYALGASSWGVWVWSLSTEGPRLPSLAPSPRSLTVYLLSMLLLMGSHGWSAPNCYNENSAFPPLGHPSQPSQGTPWTPP